MSCRKNRNYLAPVEIGVAVEELKNFADRTHVRMALLGGVAMQVYGSERLTKDVDVVVSRPVTIPGKPLTFGGVQGHTDSGIPVDIIWRDDEFKALYQEALDNTIPAPQIGPLNVVRPEYLAAMKMAAARTKDEADLLFLIAEKQINLARTREIIGEHLGPYAKLAFDQFVAEANWRRDAGR